MDFTKFKILLFYGAVFLASLISMPVFATADYVVPELVHVSTTKYDTSTLIHNPGKYSYAITWNSIPVASAEIVIGEPPQLRRTDVTPNNSDLAVRVSVRTSKGIDLLYKLRHTSESIFDVDHLKPIAFTSDQTENSKYKRWEVLFSDDHVISSKLWKDAEKDTTKTIPDESSIFNSENFTLDPIFGALLARSVPVDVGSDVAFDIWNGKHRYLIKFKVDKKEEIEMNGKKILAEKVIPSVQKLTESEGEKRIKSCVMWISADDRREILRVESKVILGSITAELTQIQPLPPPPPTVHIIQAAQPAELDETARAMLKGEK